MYLVRAKHRRVLEEAQGVLPKTATNARLRVFVLKLSRQASAPANAAVRTRHIRHCRAWRCSFEAISLRHHVGDLITAPTVPLNTDCVLVDKSFINYRLHARQHT